jgi:hypothetical protein
MFSDSSHLLGAEEVSSLLKVFAEELIPASHLLRVEDLRAAVVANAYNSHWNHELVASDFSSEIVDRTTPNRALAAFFTKKVKHIHPRFMG